MIIRKRFKFAAWAVLVLVICGSAEGSWLRPAEPSDLETRYACGGGGTYAPETGIRWYREWDGCYVKYPARSKMPHKVWTVGKMDFRPTTIRGGPDNVVLTLPCPGTYEATTAIINEILAGEGPFIRQTIEYSPAHRGNIWTIANEPNWQPYYQPADYAKEFHDYVQLIKGIDPTARIATGGLLISNTFTGPNFNKTRWEVWLDEFRSSYQSMYGTQPPVDLWDIHPYDAGDNSGGTTPAAKAINNVLAMREYLDNAGLTDAPIQISEISVLGAEQSVQVAFINEFFAWLNANAETCKVERWFWWGSSVPAFGSTGLFDGAYNRTSINPAGDAYMHQMGRVFVDPAFTPDVSRIKGSMRNPYPSLTAVLADFEAGLNGLRAGNIVYDYSTGASYVLSPSPQCDFNHDGDVDQEDFGHFQSCLTGPTVPATAGCRSADLDGDRDVDAEDAGAFLRFFSESQVNANRTGG